MRGGCLIRYYPHYFHRQQGDGFTEDLIKIASAVVLDSLQLGLRTTASGQPIDVARKVIGQS